MTVIVTCQRLEGGPHGAQFGLLVVVSVLVPIPFVVKVAAERRHLR